MALPPGGSAGTRSAVAGWLASRWSEIVTQAVITPLLTLAVNWLAQQFVQPGTVRDVGFYVIFVAVCISGVALVIYRGRSSAAAAPSAPSAGGEQFQQMVLVYRAGVTPHLRPAAGDAHVIFVFWLFNGSLSPVRVSGVSGHAKFANAEMAGDIHLMGDSPEIPRGARHRLVLRQWITPESAGRIEKTLAVTGVAADFTFDAVKAVLAGRGDGQQESERRLDLPAVTATARESWAIRWD